MKTLKRENFFSSNHMLLNKENGKLSFYSKLFLILFVPVSAYLLLSIILSLFWRVQGDHAMIFYMSFLMDHYHKIPYSEIFDMNFPGTYFIHIIIGKLTGYTDLGIRLADIFILLLISTLTFSFTKKFSTKSAFVSVLTFALIYFIGRPESTMQREYYIVGFLSVILFLNFRNMFNKNYTTFFTGILLGACFTVKPQSSIIILAFILYKYLELKYFEQSDKVFKKVFSYFIILFGGFLIPAAVMLLWLYLIGALKSFFDIVINYLPLYGSINKDLYTLTGIQKYSNMILGFFNFNERPFFLIAAAFGVYFSVFRLNLETRLRKNILLLCILAAFFSLHTVFTGQYWFHHWIPFTYLICILFSLCFIENNSIKKTEKYFMMLFVTMAVLSLFRPYQGLLFQLKGKDVDPLHEKRIAGLSDYLSKNTSANDGIQPLDWMEGTGDALLKSRKNISTRFIYDFQFYHNLSNPFIINLRNELISNLKSNPPKFIIRTVLGRAFPRGIDASSEFTELDNFIKENYVIDLQEDIYIIYKHK